MAAIYKVDLTVVSDFANYPEIDLERILRREINNYINPASGLGLRVTEMDVKKEV